MKTINIYKVLITGFTLLLLCCAGAAPTVRAQESGEARLPAFAFTNPAPVSLSLEASQFTGEASASYPIELLPAAGGIQEELELALHYRSGGKNSWVGKGWELEAGYIVQMNKLGAKSAQNPYLLVLNGQYHELVYVSNNEYQTKWLSDIKRIQLSGSTWKAWRNNGTLYTFGRSGASRYLLTKVTDSHGFSLNISYEARQDNEELYLKELTYPEGPGVSQYCKLTFVSEPRDDGIISYSYGSAMRLDHRLKEIQLSVDGITQKKYTLTYANKGDSKLSLLSSITEHGKDGAVLPAASFTYQEPKEQNIFASYEKEWLADKGAFYTHQPSRNVLPEEGLVFPAGMNLTIIDLNNDNLPDLLGCKYSDSHNSSQSEWVAYLNEGDRFSSQEKKWAEFDASYKDGGRTVYDDPITLSTNAMLIDMNKDGLPDLVYSKRGGSKNHLGLNKSIYDIFVRYNTGSKFSDTETRLFDCNKAYYIFETIFSRILIGEGATLTDINGDGLPDLVYNKVRGWVHWDLPMWTPHKNYAKCDWVVRFNTGEGFSDTEKVWLEADKAYFTYELDVINGGKEPVFEHITVNNNSLLADINNDGLPDLVYNDFAGQVQVDKLDDPFLNRVPKYYWKVRYNTGEKFSDKEVTYAMTSVYSYRIDDRANKRAVSVKIGVNGTLADINGDGLPDLVYNKYKDGPNDPAGFGKRMPEVSWLARFNEGAKFNHAERSLMNTHDYYFDNNTKYASVATYNSYFTDMNSDGLADFIYPQFTAWQTSKARLKVEGRLNSGSFDTSLLTKQTSPFGGESRIAYEPSSSFDNSGSDDKNDLPFVTPLVKTLIKDPGVDAAGATTYEYKDGWYDGPNREFRGFGYVKTTDPLGYVSHSYFHQDDSRLGRIEKEENDIVKITNTYKEDVSAPYFTPLIQVDTQTDTKTSRVIYEYDDYANIIKTAYHGDIDLTGDEKCVLSDYAVNTSNWIVNLPSRERTFSGIDASGAVSAETQYFYDNNVNYTDTPVKGDLTALKEYLNTESRYITESFTYDSCGNQTSMTDARGNKTEITYDSIYHFLPMSVKNAKGHIETSAYYMPADTKGIFGQLKSQTDPNDATTSYEYDGFGRKTKIIGPYDAFSTYGSQSCEYGMGGPGANYILTRSTEKNGASNHLINVEILDGFERAVQSAKESETDGIYSYRTTIYNARGETAKSGLPYFKDGGLRTAYLAPGDAVKWTEYLYDAIGRVTKIIKPDSAEVNSVYSGWTTTVSDENAHLKTFTKDAYGRLVIVKEKNRDEEHTTTYSYDVLDNLALITDHFNNKTEFSYDSLSRRRAMADPALGSWTYDYDDNGNLSRNKNGNGAVINFDYDKLNCLTKKDYVSSAGVEVTYNYDETASSNGIGRRTSMQDLSGSSRWDYDKEGRIVKIKKTVGGAAYNVEWKYDALDRVEEIIFPNSKTVNFTYNNAGLSESADGFVLNAEYNAASLLELITFSNPVVSRFSYYLENQRLKSIIAGSLQDLSYEYDKAGNVKKITDAVRSAAKDYAYDELDRLTSGDSNSYKYNAIGNITEVNGAAQTYSSVKPHALTGDGASAYSYDACGNMVSKQGQGDLSVSYDSENRPVRITKGGIVTEFVYDGDGARVKKTISSPASATIYIAGLYEKEE